MVANHLTHLLEDGSKITPSTKLAWVAQFQSRWQDAERWHKKSLETSEKKDELLLNSFRVENNLKKENN